jgi:hypothetical protein
MSTALERREIICSELSEDMDQISTHASMLCSRTHKRNEVERNIDEIINLVEKLDSKVQNTKRNFIEWKEMLKGGAL